MSDAQLSLFNREPPPELQKQPEPPDGYSYYVVAEGSTPILARNACLVDGPRIEACFWLKWVMGWFGWNDRVKLGMEIMVAMNSDEECDGIVLKKGRSHWKHLNFCPFCGQSIDAKLAPRAREQQTGDTDGR